MQCPFCGNDSSVTETRVSPDGVRRRRVCASCKRRFTTYERVGSPGLKVEKRDGRLEPFEADKLGGALTRVCRHRAGVGPDDLKRIVRDVEASLLDSGAKTASWAEIVRLVLDRLVAIDRVAAERLRANYVDEDGRLRLDEPAASPDAERPQLGLFLGDER
ncbi:MAG TPA: ATP cone domain-containing protein [Kofleriaceae bacterium]|nr:ATP cone domain-containing protein [Kofleriaceae bacterium]